MNLVIKVLVGMLIYLVFLIALFPANIALGLAPLPKHIAFGGVSGTIWSGSIETLTLQKRQLELVKWDVSPWSLMTGRVKLDLSTGNRGTAVNGKGAITYSLAGVDAQGLRFEAPSSFLLGGTRLPFKTKVNSDISVLVDAFEQGAPWCEQLSGKLFLNQFRVSNQFGDYPLGDIELGLSCVDGNVKVKSDETMNQLGLSGTVLVKAEKMVQVSGKIKETPSQPEDLKKALSFLGKKDSQGYYPISYQGRIPF